MFIRYLKKSQEVLVYILLKLRRFLGVLITPLYISFSDLRNNRPNIWGNTYVCTIEPLVTLEKKAVRIITFSNFQAHTNPLFLRLKILKLKDIITFNTALFMHDYYQGKLRDIFEDMCHSLIYFIYVNDHEATEAIFFLFI